VITQLDVAREALAQIGTRSTLASLDDGSAEAQYVNLLYAPIRDFLLVDGDWDFSLVGVKVLCDPIDQGSPYGFRPWLFEADYPAGALRIRQCIPEDFDPLDPRPVEWNIGSSGGQKQILTRVAIQQVLTTQAVPEDWWDAIFREAFVRLLGSALAFALENRIEASKAKLDEALGFAGIGKMRDE
jgi:hypothetical protein